MIGFTLFKQNMKMYQIFLNKIDLSKIVLVLQVARSQNVNIANMQKYLFKKGLKLFSWDKQMSHVYLVSQVGKRMFVCLSVSTECEKKKKKQRQKLQSFGCARFKSARTIFSLLFLKVLH